VESPPDLHRTHLHSSYPGTRYSEQPDPELPPVRKMLPSSHCIQLHCRKARHLFHPVCSSSPPDGMSYHDCKYSDTKPHPYIHASDSENPYHYSLPPDKQSYPDTSLHLKMYSKIPSPALQMDPLPGNSLTRRVRNAP